MTTEQIEVPVDLGSFRALAAVLPAPPRAVSPFAGVEAASPSAAERARLETLAGSMKRALAVLADATAVVRVQLAGGDAVFDYAQYSTANGEAPVALLTADDGVRVQDPGPAGAVVAYLAEQIGDSGIVGTGFDAQLSADDAVVLAALVDHRRRTILREVAGDPPPTKAEGLTVDGVRSLTVDAHPAGLTRAVMYAAGVASLAKPAVSAAIKSLQGAGLATKSGHGVAAGDAARDLAGRFTVNQRVLTLFAGRELEDGSVVRAGFVAAVAGLHDVLVIERMEDGVHLETVSSGQVVDYVRFFLETPEALAAPDGAAPTDDPGTRRRRRR